MTFDPEHYARERQRLIDGHAYDPASERDACGVGLVAAIDGKPRREVIDLALKALKAIWHRGAVDADGKSGDGAGILIGLPRAFFEAHAETSTMKLGWTEWGRPKWATWLGRCRGRGEAVCQWASPAR
jgi:glutamate synthase (NADPH/NADH) large chain